MIWVVGTLVLALIWCLGTIIKLEWQISQLESQLDTQIEALMMLRSRTETRSTATRSVQFNDPPTGMRCHE